MGKDDRCDAPGVAGNALRNGGAGGDGTNDGMVAVSPQLAPEPEEAQ